MAGEAQADEPLAVELPRRLLQQRHPPPVVLDQVVERGEDGARAPLRPQARKTLKLQLTDVFHVHVLRGCTRFARQQHSLLRRYQKEVAKEIRIDLLGIGPQMDRSLPQADALPILDNRNVPCRCLASKDSVSVVSKSSSVTGTAALSAHTRPGASPKPRPSIVWPYFHQPGECGGAAVTTGAKIRAAPTARRRMCECRRHRCRSAPRCGAAPLALRRKCHG
jgi:hypothetical protein